MAQIIPLETPFLSVVIPVYKVEKYIRKCMESILFQGYGDYEIILVDDGSPDNCGIICDEYAKMYLDKVFVIHQENSGLSGARNAGLRHSRGQYIFFVDSDDTIETDALKIIAEALKTYDYPDMLVFNSKSVDESGNTMFSRIPSCLEKYRAPVGKLMNIHEEKELLLEYHGAWCRVTKKNVFTKNNILFPQKLWYEDLVSTAMLLSCSSSIGYINDSLYIYLHRQGSIMNTINAERMCDDMIAVIKLIVDWFSKKGLFDEFYTQIEYIALYQLMLIQASKIAVLPDTNIRKRLNKLVDFVIKTFPNYKRNIYLNKRNKKDLFKIFLLDSKCFGILRFVLKLNNLFKRVT